MCAGFREQSWVSVTGFFCGIQSNPDYSELPGYLQLLLWINQPALCLQKKKRKEASQFQWEQLIVTVLLQREKRKKIFIKIIFFLEPGS